MTPLASVITTLLYCSAICGSISYVANVIFFIIERGIAHFLCAMFVFNVRASSSPLGYLCVKFCYFHDLHCWANPWRKIGQSLSHSLAQLIWCPANWSTCASEL